MALTQESEQPEPRKRWFGVHHRRIAMTIRSLAMALVVSALPGLACAEPQRETFGAKVQHEIPDIPGKSLVAIVVKYAPGAKSVPHRHAGSAFIFAHVMSGAVRSQVDDEPAKVYQAGESWTERQGTLHRMSENASMTEPASLLAVFIVDTADTALTRPAKGEVSPTTGQAAQ
jgi:quercetin dioxygenase-like cupin family protein